MDFKNNKQPGFQPNRCMVCDSPLIQNPIKPDVPKICNHVQCQALYKQRLDMSPALYKQHFQRQQQYIIQKKFAEIEKQKHIERVKHAEFDENEIMRKRAEDRLSSRNGRSIKVTQIPTGLEALKPLEAERINEYLQHVQSAIERACEVEDISELLDDQLLATHQSLLLQDARITSNPMLEAEVEKLCGLCRGGCCAAGGNHAYIHAVTVRRLMDGLSVNAGELLDFYQQHLPQFSIVGSCINQTPTGCSLPRQYRSDVCNLYLCEELEEHLAWKESDQAHSEINLVVQRGNTNWNRFEAVEKNPVTCAYLENDEGELMQRAPEILLMPDQPD